MLQQVHRLFGARKCVHVLNVVLRADKVVLFSLRSDVLEHHYEVILINQHLWSLECLFANLTELADFQHFIFIIGVKLVNLV